MNKLLIIDGNSLIFRAYYALPYLSDTKGQPTGAIFGFLNMFLKVIGEYNPTHIAVAFDHSRKTFRNKIFAEYKGTRKETPDDLRQQFPLMKEFLRAMGVKCLEQQCIEADDIVGTLSKIPNCQKVVLSGDRDVLQLIDDDCEVWLTKKGISEIYRVDKEVLLQDFRLTPPQIVDLKALMGDASDNIPGVKGIGPKTATDLIEQFDSLENLYDNLDNPNINKGTKNKLIDGKEVAFMSKTLATIKTDCEVDMNLDAYKLTLPFPVEVTNLLYDYEISSFVNRHNFFTPSAKRQEENEPFEEVFISTVLDIEKLVANNKAEKFAFEIGENTLAFSFGDKKVYKIKDEYDLFYQPPEISDCLYALKGVFENENVQKITSDVKKTLHYLKGQKIALNGEAFDLKIAEYILNLKNLEKSDVDRFFKLEAEYKKLLKNLNLIGLYDDIDRPLVDVLFEMENNGFKLDVNELNLLSEILDKKLEVSTNRIYELAGKTFNLASPKQLAEVLFEDLNLPFTDNKKQSTSFEVLINLIDLHPIVAEVLEFRKLQTLRQTYVETYKKLVSQNGDVVHTIFNQTLTATGRLSSSEPNLQNIPVREGEGKDLRKIFISRFEDGCLVSADYNQIELRLLAHCSGDPKLLNAFNENKDIHVTTASQIFGINENEVTAEQRRDAKAVNFGIIYGISEFGLSQNMRISRRDAGEYIKKYFETYPEVKKYMDKSVENAKKYGYAKTIFNRRRKVSELNSDNFQVRQFGSRVAMNMPLQGSAADIIKIAMLKVNEELKRRNLQSKLILQIHDELIIDSPKNEVEEVKQLLKDCMEGAVKLDVPLPVDVQSGKSFFEL
ncbi:MAG: DNA polymerase I [Clostridia bacterium]|nr:DNA polymerase I [Clostridia bacterium]